LRDPGLGAVKVRVFSRAEAMSFAIAGGGAM
jgi:hypothetical protein